MTDIPNTPYWQPKLGSEGEVCTGLDEVAQAIEIIMGTLLGAVPLLPLFGVDLLSYVDRPITTAPRKTERMILKALRLWEPRIDVAAVRVEPIDILMGAVAVCLIWKLKDSNNAIVQVLGISNGVTA